MWRVRTARLDLGKVGIGRELQPDIRRTIDSDTGPSTVCVRDHVDNGEIEPGTGARASSVYLNESLERVVDKAVREAVSFVTHAELNKFLVSSGAQRDRSCAMAQSIVDKVAEGLLVPRAVAPERKVGSGVHLDKSRSPA